VDVDWQYRRVESTEELLDGLQDRGAVVICGGTDVMVKLRSGLLAPTVLLDVSRLDALRGIREEERHLVIGAAATETELLESDTIRRRLPLLAAVLEKLGSVQIRNRGTLGGNLVNASPAADGAIPLLLYEAEVVLASRGGYRRMPVEEFLVSPGRTQLHPGEYLQEIRVPIQQEVPLGRFHKVGRRRALTIAIASLGMLCRLEDERIAWIRFAAGSVAPRPIRLREVEALLKDTVLDPRRIEEARERAEASVMPIDDVRGPAAYRRAVIGRLVAAFLNELSDA
jgi:CO/xanthine dehydrogenase FAD-binding subunit